MNRWWMPLLLLGSACISFSFINYLGKGYEAYQNGDLDGAEKFFRMAIKKKSRDPIAHNNLGLVLMELDRSEEAIRFFKLATLLDKNRDYAAPHANLARAYFEAGKLDLALQSGEKARDMNPNNPVVLLTLANVYCARNEKLIEARKFAHAATSKVGPADQAAAWSTLAEAEYKLNNIDAAVIAIDTAIALDTDNPFYRQQKALYRP